jgi:hypothetical protein
MDDSNEDFANMVYLLIEIECSACHRRFAEPEGKTEAEVWKWAQATTEAAYRAGWRAFPDKILCPTCIQG